MTPEVEAALARLRHRQSGNPDLLTLIEELTRLDAVINNPETAEFVKGMQCEAAYQAEHWPVDDSKKTPSDWFWTLGYLGGKAMNHQIGGDIPKALHHVISTAALCSRWHAHLIGKVRPPPPAVAAPCSASLVRQLIAARVCPLEIIGDVAWEPHQQEWRAMVGLPPGPLLLMAFKLSNWEIPDNLQSQAAVTDGA